MGAEPALISLQVRGWGLEGHRSPSEGWLGMFNVSRPGGFEVFSHMMEMVSLVKLEHSKSVGQSSPPATKCLAGYCQQLPFRVCCRA